MQFSQNFTNVRKDDSCKLLFQTKIDLLYCQIFLWTMWYSINLPGVCSYYKDSIYWVYLWLVNFVYYLIFPLHQDVTSTFLPWAYTGIILLGRTAKLSSLLNKIIFWDMLLKSWKGDIFWSFYSTKKIRYILNAVQMWPFLVIKL